VAVVVCIVLVLLGYQEWGVLEIEKEGKVSDAEGLDVIFVRGHKDPYSYIATIEHLCGSLCSIGGNFSDGKFFKHRTIPQMKCDAYFQEEVMSIQGHGQQHAPNTIPNEWLNAFTLGGIVPVSEWYIDENYIDSDEVLTTVTNNDNQVLYWSETYVNSMIDLAKEGKLPGNYGLHETNALRNALRVAQEQIRGGRVLVIGSENPWVEACVLEAGAASVVTLEFATIKTDHSKLVAMTPLEFGKEYVEGTLGQFDAVVSFSSLEHTGLGRYGDALNPWGDILEVARAWCVTRDGGALVVGVMYGKDALKFNAGRWYGAMRWPYLTTNWYQEWRAPTATYDGEVQRMHVFRKRSQRSRISNENDGKVYSHSSR